MSSLLSNETADDVSTVVNLTPFNVTIIDGEKNFEFPISGEEVARIVSDSEKVGTALGIPLFAAKHLYVGGLLDPQTGVFLLVLPEVRLALPERKDLLSPANCIFFGGDAIATGFDVNP